MSSEQLDQAVIGAELARLGARAPVSEEIALRILEVTKGERRPLDLLRARGDAARAYKKAALRELVADGSGDARSPEDVAREIVGMADRHAVTIGLPSAPPVALVAMAEHLEQEAAVLRRLAAERDR